MPDHGALTADHFKHQKLVWSGHFHKRQRKNHILYMGNAFPHNYADAGDDERGIAFWKPGQDPEFLSWPGAPKFRVYNLSEILNNPGKFVDNRTFVRINVDLDINYEDAMFLKELFETELNALDVNLINNRSNIDEVDFREGEINFESVDSIVLSHLKTIESTTMNVDTLIKIYQAI